MFRTLFAGLFLASPVSADFLTFSDIAGHYVVTSARMSSHVAQPLDPDAEDPTGFELVITDAGLEIPGEDCADWSLTPTEVFLHPRFDPNLADVFLEPLGYPTYTVRCGEAHHTLLTYVDARVLVMTIDNDAAMAVIEKPLTDDEIGAVQAALVARGFLDAATGEMDDATHAAMRLHFRAEFDDGEMAIPLRPAYTAAFLRTLGIE